MLSIMFQNKNRVKISENVKNDSIGKAYIIGAGPGDPELLTLKAYKILQKANVVLYDALISEEILEIIPKSVFKIYVGKRKHNHSLPQDEINNLLQKYVKEGKTVVRLKGGDPFIFGRGGEEYCHLLKLGLPVEVIPGVSSFYSAPERFGIPLTFRNIASSFAVITGHCAQKGCIDFKTLKGIDTLVFLMAVSNRQKIAQRLLEIGKEETTPVAFVSNAYRKGEKLIASTLMEVAKNPPKVEPPAVMVVGKVVSLIGKRCF